MPRRFLLAWSAFALLVSVQVTGCSLIGYGIGTAIDAGAPLKLRPGEIVEVVRLEPGSTVVLRLRDGSRVEGRYLGLEPRPDSAYAARYAAWRDTAALGFRTPRIGEAIRIRYAANPRFLRSRVEFLGFGPRRAYVVGRGGGAFAVPFGTIRRLTDAGAASVSGEALLAAADRLPVQAIAIVRRDRLERRVDLLDGSVAAVEISPPSRTARKAGLIIGVLADATMVVAFATAMSSYGCESVGGTATNDWDRVGPDTLWRLPQARAALAAAE